MSSYTGAVNMSGTDASIIADLIQQLADTKLANQDLEERLETVTSERDDYKGELKEFKAAREVIAPGDPDATNNQWDDDEEEEYEEVDDAEVYDDKIRDKARILELESTVNKVTLESQMTIRGLKWDNVELHCENKDLREEVEVVTKERDSATATMLRERAAHLKSKDGVTSGRVTKDKSKTPRHAGALADNITLALRQKEDNGRT
ncbi:uncharacterized protein J4E87_004538 [Alternaria ethzedia]|uniref:uncharacterized protein n=1 Tax=Alternaria ethzedia TaxID=181014 RepID=UPI0020C3264E|nr:uncharacterized protein J4E87_004538 [Alternaria ethzedia]KAI4627196.1 hypothetical protein J4E87_004538 [Alternaria ethzedia]